MRPETFKIGGMTCGGCIETVANALNAVDGVSDVAMSLKLGEARIEFDERATSIERLRAAIREAGYEVAVAGGTSPAKAGCCS